MSLDKSLVSKQRLARHRNVLSRAERIAILEEEGRWQEGDPLFGLPKVKNIKVKRRAKGAEKKEEAAEAAAVEAEAAEALGEEAEAKDTKDTKDTKDAKDVKDTEDKK